MIIKLVIIYTCDQYNNGLSFAAMIHRHTPLENMKPIDLFSFCWILCSAGAIHASSYFLHHMFPVLQYLIEKQGHWKAYWPRMHGAPMPSSKGCPAWLEPAMQLFHHKWRQTLLLAIPSSFYITSWYQHFTGSVDYCIRSTVFYQWIAEDLFQLL